MRPIDFILQFVGAAVLAGSMLGAAAGGGVGETNQSVSISSITSSLKSGNSSSESIQDPAASKFLMACAGCHSLTGVKLNGPDLSPVGAWPTEQLKLAIKKMESKAGPLSENDLNMLAELLRDGKARERIKAAEARIAAMFMAKLEPPNAALGKALFDGQEPLRNGGLACVACHMAQGRGGNLGPDLTGSFAKLGELPLVSAIEQSNYKIMGPHYRTHPITKQEAMHLTRFLSTLDGPGTRPPPVSFAALGAGGGLAAFAGLLLLYRRSGRTRLGRLQRRRK